MSYIKVVFLLMLSFTTADAQIVGDVNIVSPHHYPDKNKKTKVVDLFYREMNKPIVLLNGNYVISEVLNTLDPNFIESLQIEKKNIEINETLYNAKFIIKTKPDYNVKLLSLNELLSHHNIKKSGNIISLIDDEIIDVDADTQFLNDDRILQIKVLKLNKIDENNPHIFLKILTNTPENIKKINTVYIRGNQ